ncbi:MAG: hypothetical protein J6U90_03790 [Methanobrevibacter sp.]|nr:hypothetical protein [Methanobrevibacter sp.]
MKNLINTTPFINEVREMRKAMVENLIELMRQHGVSEVYCSAVNDCPPVIHNGIYEDETYTLDTITLISCGDNVNILLEGVSECSNGNIYASQMDIELLVEVHNWVMDYVDELFEPIKE